MYGGASFHLRLLARPPRGSCSSQLETRTCILTDCTPIIACLLHQCKTYQPTMPSKIPTNNDPLATLIDEDMCPLCWLALRASAVSRHVCVHGIRLRQYGTVVRYLFVVTTLYSHGGDARSLGCIDLSTPRPSLDHHVLLVS